MIYTSAPPSIQAPDDYQAQHFLQTNDVASTPFTTVASADPAAGVAFILREIGPTTLVAIHPDTSPTGGYWLDEASRDQAAAWATARNAAGWNIYYTANPPREGMRTKAAKADINAIRCVFDDDDAKDGRTLADCHEAIARLPLPPSLIIMSGGGYQPVWLISEPLAPTPENVARAENIGREIATRTGGDHVQNIDRILRMPFTVNYPNEKKRRSGRVPTVAGVLTKGGPRYTIAELEAAFPPTEQPQMSGAAASNVVQLSGTRAAVFTVQSGLPDMNAAALANRPDHEWFRDLDPAAKNAVVKLCLDTLDNTVVDPRDTWRDVGWACQDAEAKGADQAVALFKGWSHRGHGFAGYGDIETLLRSNKPGTGRLVGVGTLIAKAVAAGADLRHYREPASPITTVVGPNAAALGVAGAAPAAISSLPKTMKPTDALLQTNPMFFFAHNWGGEAIIGHEGRDGVRAVSEQQFKAMLTNRYVEVPKATDDGGNVTSVRRVPLGDFWLAHPQRREFDRVLYDPEGTRGHAGEQTFNLWNGFARVPRRGAWKLMARHLHGVICKCDRLAWRYLIRWLAHAVQHPGTAPGTVTVFKSDAEGTGKSAVLSWLASMFGKHALMLSTPEDLIGQFNDHLESRSLIGLNEPSFPGDHRANGKLKAMITEAEWLLNGKFRAARRVPNIAHIMLTTNASWAVPAGNHARRFLVLDVDERRANDRAYFNLLWHEAGSGGIEAMLYALLHVDLSTFDPREVPKTTALKGQQLRSASAVTQWAMDAVASRELITPPLGFAPLTGGGFGMRHRSSVLFEECQRWAAGMKQRPISLVEFGRWLGRCGFPRVMLHGAPYYDIPTAPEFGVAVLRQAGIPL